MRKGQILAVLGIAVVAGGIATAVAVVPTWLPVQASREAGRIDFTIWFTIVISIVIFAVVAAVMIYSIYRFRAPQADDWSEGPPVHGSTGLEIVWTVIPLLIVTSIAIVSAIVLSRNGSAGNNPLQVDVTAVQYSWSFTYPDAHGLTSSVLRLPKDRSVVLTISTKDVIHSFWVPEFGQKQDAVPGLHTHVHITPDRLGSYPVICVELCGLGHSVMRSTAIVMTPAAFDKWIKQQTAAITSPSASASGAAVFTNNGCGACHTLVAAKATGKIGPDLDKLKAYAQQAGQPLDQFISESITDPNKYIQPGYPKSVMPGTFGASLSKAQLDALVQYLIDSAKG
ncbi:MAG TPA: cytochrome c oxidase subunit II [Gaiellaceae bacterium]|nr:cytochrome c oxidase subunit II [Gaiellaceae bacterium]HVN60425.1 cytochrome c oxidase subunit II [Gaiellaceae bacterium]